MHTTFKGKEADAEEEKPKSHVKAPHTRYTNPSNKKDTGKKSALLSKTQKFDLMVFERTSDYLCYVEAVHMLYKENTF